MVVETNSAVLVVEDHADTAEMIKRTLARSGVTAEVVASGAAALEFLEQTRPCCLILDQSMPDMTGLELYRQLVSRPQFKDLPTFFYTASFDWRRQMEAEELGVRGWYVKGISRLTDLIEQVVAVCRAG